MLVPSTAYLLKESSEVRFLPLYVVSLVKLEQIFHHWPRWGYRNFFVANSRSESHERLFKRDLGSFSKCKIGTDSFLCRFRQHKRLWFPNWTIKSYNMYCRFFGCPKSETGLSKSVFHGERCTNWVSISFRSLSISGSSSRTRLSGLLIPS